MIDIWVLDENYRLKGVIDNYKSVIWTERLSENGDFEIYCPNNIYNYNILSLNADVYVPVFITRSDDQTKIGILTNVRYVHDVDNGDMIIASGFTDDYLLHYRVVFEQSSYFGNTEYVIRHMVRNAMIQSEFQFVNRDISNMTLGNAIGLPDTYKVNVQLQGDYLDEAVSRICKDQGIGYLIEFDFFSRNFIFNLIAGRDKPEIVFSTGLDNLLSSEYSNVNKPNTAYAIGAGNGVDKLMGQYDAYVIEKTGIYRQEFYVDAEKLSNNAESFDTLMYVNLLRSKAKQSLIDKFGSGETVQSSVAANSYKLGVDYKLGDVVTVIIDIGVEQTQKKAIRQKIIETVECWDENGYTCEPTFESV